MRLHSTKYIFYYLVTFEVNNLCGGVAIAVGDLSCVAVTIYNCFLRTHCHIAYKDSLSSLYHKQGSWKGLKAGGCFNYGSWRFNPQFTLKLDKKAKVDVTLEQQGTDYSIGVYILPSSGW